MSILFPYDQSHPGPAFPIIDVSMIGHDFQYVHNATCLVDTGADATIVPLQYLQQMNARQVDIAWARTVTGERYQVDIYSVTITLDNRTISDVEVIANEHSDEVILGRNVLNQILITLDGPGAVVHVEY